MSIKVIIEFADADALVQFFTKPQAHAGVIAAAAQQAVDKAKATPEKPKAAPPAAAPAVSAEPAPSPAPSPAAAATQSAPADKPKADAVDYPTLQKAVFALAGKGPDGRAAAGELAQSFGVKTFKDLDSAKWGEALQAVNAKLNEVDKAKMAAAEEAVA